MGVVLRFHAESSIGHRSGRRSDLGIPVSRSMGRTNSAGTPRLDFSSQYQTWDCVVPMRAARAFWPPTASHARRSASVDIRRQYPVLGKGQPKNQFRPNNLFIGKVPPMGTGTQPSAGFGDRVRYRRLELQMSVDRLMELTGYSQSNISHIERGGTKKPEKIAHLLAKALQTTAEWLLHGTGSNPPPPPILTLGAHMWTIGLPLVTPTGTGFPRLCARPRVPEKNLADTHF